MPAFLTHWHILIETARSSQDVGNDLGSLIIDAATLRRRAHGWSTPPQTSPAGAVWETGPLPEIDFRLPGSDISAMAFLGALAPDIMYYQRRYLRKKLADAHLRSPQTVPPERRHPPLWSELFHHTHTGELPMLFLEQVALVPSPALRSQALAFALGYISHIAADIALNPWITTQATRLQRRSLLSSHYVCALLLDEYLASTCFEHARYSPLHQPWGGYIEPAARNLSQAGTPTAQLLPLLASALEVYQLGRNQIETFPADFLTGLQGLRRFLSGRGQARWLPLLAGRSKSRWTDIHLLFHEGQNHTGNVSLEQILIYAARLSEHLCRLAVNYYTALRNPSAEASERSSRRAALIADLCNWDLATGLFIAQDRQAPPPAEPHNWTHFTQLWEPPAPGQAQPASLIGQTG
jgi:hypothetical protein